MAVDSSSSESDSEESESKSETDPSESSESSESSDSDGLENWMLLGRGNQDGDQTISLNLEGGCDSNAGVCVFVHIYVAYVCTLFVLGVLSIVQSFVICFYVFKCV